MGFDSSGVVALLLRFNLVFFDLSFSGYKRVVFALYLSAVSNSGHTLVGYRNPWRQ